MIKAIIFDFFGVIRPDNLRATYQQLGGDLEKDEHFISDTTFASVHGLIPNSRAAFAKKLGVTEARWLQALEEGIGNDQRLLDYAKELHKTYKTAILSNVSSGRLEELLSPEELGRFDVVIASGDIGYAKPEPEAYKTVADRLHVHMNECVFTDDLSDFCDGARAVGMQAIHYKSFDQFRRELDTVLHNEHKDI